MRRLALILAACIGAASATTAQAPAPPGLLISPAELAGRLKDPSLVILHVADRDTSFREGHVPGARFLRYGDFALTVDGIGSELPSAAELKRVFEAVGVSDSARVVIYGSSPVVAARAFFTLDAAGHSRVMLLDGGLRAWRADGRPVESGDSTTPAPAAQFTPKVDLAKVASADFIQQQMRKTAIALVDVRPDPEFLGTDGGMGGVHTPGHIAGAHQLTWNALVSEDGRFLPREQLEAKLRAAGAAQGKPVVAYCMVGMRASVVYFIARHLGYDAKLYDGSIVDWSRRKLPTIVGRP